MGYSARPVEHGPMAKSGKRGAKELSETDPQKGVDAKLKNAKVRDPDER